VNHLAGDPRFKLEKLIGQTPGRDHKKSGIVLPCPADQINSIDRCVTAFLPQRIPEPSRHEVRKIGLP
jgi:hypothetical protein